MEQLQHGTDGTPGVLRMADEARERRKKNWKTRWVKKRRRRKVLIKVGLPTTKPSHSDPTALCMPSRSALGGPTGPMTLSGCTVSNVKSNVLAGTSSGFLLRSGQKELHLQQCHEPPRAAASYNRERRIAEMVAQGCKPG